MKLKEIIVVEGKADTAAIKRAVDADTIETNGSAVDSSTIEKIKLAAQTRGVIILTDPDFPGEKIRKTIAEHVPNCKHAFLPKHLARQKHDKGVGVEHASPEAIRQALKNAHREEQKIQEVISLQDLLDFGFIGHPQSKNRREKLGQLLKIGYANGKQLHKRLNMFRISKDKFFEAAQRVVQEELQNE